MPEIGNKLKYSVKYYLNQINTKGRLAWEYNPFHNFRRTKNTDENGLHSNQLKLFGDIYTKLQENNGVSKYVGYSGKLLIINNSVNPPTYSLDGKEIESNVVDKNIISYTAGEDIEAGSLVDLDTELLGFSLNHPVNIEIQPSYDGSVNLILNDGKNPPRLINSRFSTRQLNTYEVVDRIGDNDTNIYDDDFDLFDLDTSLYKRYLKIPQVRFNRVISSGNLKVGNYTLYFKYCDADGNETDFVAESGIISVFKGNDKDPTSIDGGIADMRAFKSIDVTLYNIDEAYDYVKVYYTRSSADFDLNRQTLAYEILNKFVVSHRSCNIIINGDENVADIPLSDLNKEYFIASTAKTLALCQNMLFLGNVSKPDSLHLDLTDISLRILPYLNSEDSVNVIGRVNSDTYIDTTSLNTNFEYYNTKNIYYNVGYWNEEIYRFGVVYIMLDNTLSKVYNIRGISELPEFKDTQEATPAALEEDTSEENPIQKGYTDVGPIFDDNGNRQYIKVSESDYSIINGKYLENSRGVVRFNTSSSKELIYSIGVYISKEVLNYLKNYCGIKGFFFVRLKRIPTILAQGLVVPIDPLARVPMVYYKKESTDNYEIESFITKDKLIVHDYKDRMLSLNNVSNSTSSKNILENAKECAIICPEFETNQGYFNQFFTGSEFQIKYSNILFGNLELSRRNERFYTFTADNSTSSSTTETITTAKLCAVTDEVPTIVINDSIFRGVCGMAEEGFRFEYGIRDGEKTKDDTNLVRGLYSPYIAAIFSNVVNYGKIVNIYIPGYNISELTNYFSIRYNDTSPYYPIGDRVAIDELIDYLESADAYTKNFYRGDCFICTFTHRLNRNFLDPAAPSNDKIVDKKSWKGFDPENEETFEDINLGDINAVKMGSWYTFRVRSSTNLSVRSLNESIPGEKGVFGLSRGFYPRLSELISGNAKIPDSYLINDGFRSTVGEKLYLRYPDVPYIKNNFENRILYSEIAINDAFRNGYRVFKSVNFNDYSKEYGSIIKLVNLLGGLLCVFEHGVAYIPVNERAVAGEGAGGNIYINTSKVLPDNPKILSDKFGSQWQESIVLTPYYIYGIDTVGKKIWRTNGGQFEVISDFAVNKFLVDNITLTERELTPIIGVRNVKSHYNANKSDVMFTFYDSQYGIEEKAWNLCYNEITLKFTTFYSWIPSYSENIDNIFFSFDRATSKAIAKLGTSLSGSTTADGITLDCVVLGSDKTANIVGLENRILPDISNKNLKFEIEYSKEEDPYGNYKYFKLEDKKLIFDPDPPTEVPRPDNIASIVSSIPSKNDIGEDNCFEKEEEIDTIMSLSNIYETYRNEFKEVLDDGTISYTKAESYYSDLLNYVSYLRKWIVFVNLNIDAKKVWFVNIKATINVENTSVGDYKTYLKTFESEYLGYNYAYYTSTIAVTSEKVFENYVKYSLSDDGLFKQNKKNINVEVLTTDFWKHGLAGIIDIKDDIRPCLWYGKQHPFEFEFVVRDTPNMHKIFDNLEIISNKCEPESFHFEVVGETYEFNNDKRNMYYRLEATKELWQGQGVDIVFDRRYEEITPRLNEKSTIFPLYYNRIDTFDEIYDSYTKMSGTNKDYTNLSGSEIIRDKDLDEYRIVTHIENTPIDKIVTDRFGRKVQIGRIRGNSHYKEDRWKILIPSITFMLKNELWTANTKGKIVPPIVVNYIPTGFTGDEISTEHLPNTYDYTNIETNKWTYRKETKIRDKYLKVRVRYTGDLLAIITAILTTYTESYA